MTTLDLTLIRHGETEWNATGRWQGWTDVPLSDVGKQQARRLAPRLARRTFDRVYSSDLTRARQTAELALPALAPTPEQRLRELHFGRYEGYTFEEVKADGDYAEWHRDTWGRPAPAGGESFETVAQRLREWIDEQPNGEIIAFTHGAAIRALVWSLLEWPRAYQPGGAPLPFPAQIAHTSITRLRRKGDFWTVVTLNDHAHLEGLS